MTSAAAAPPPPLVIPPPPQAAASSSVSLCLAMEIMRLLSTVSDMCSRNRESLKALVSHGEEES